MRKKVSYLALFISLMLCIRCAIICEACKDMMTIDIDENGGAVRQTRSRLTPLPADSGSERASLDLWNPSRALDFHTFLDPNILSGWSFENWSRENVTTISCK